MYKDIKNILKQDENTYTQEVIWFWPHSNSRKKVEHVKEIKYIIVEGFFLLWDVKLRSLADEIIYIKTDI